MTCIIIEDQAPAQRILQKFINDYGHLDLKGTFSDPIEAASFLQSNNIDVLFLDIHLPKITGVNFLKTIQNKPHTIFTTAYPEYAVEGFELNVVDYLLKPFSFDRFVQAVLKIPAKTQMSHKSGTEAKLTSRKFPSEIFIKSGYEYIKVATKEIICIKADMDYTELLIIGNKKNLSSESLKYWQDSLHPDLFVRIHKSYIVNMSHVCKIVGNQVFLVNDAVLPIGRAFKEDVMRHLH